MRKAFILLSFISSVVGGADSAARDKHSFSQPELFRTEHLDLDLSVSFEKRQLEGSVVLTLKDLRSKNEELILDTMDLEVLKVETGTDTSHLTTVTTRFGNPDKVLGTPLYVPVTQGHRYVKVHYRTSQSAKALGWMDPKLSATGKTPFLYSLSQPHLGRSWIPCQDTPNVRVTYSARIHVPKDLLAVMSASNPQRKNETGKYRFEMRQPIPSYLIALAAGDLSFKSVGARTGVYAEPSLIDAAAKEFEDLENILLHAEQAWGPYLWERFDVLVPPKSFPYWGMENPRLTFASAAIVVGDKSGISTIVHELSHSWSGNLVTNASWEDFWLNEGFTRYLERRLLESLYGSEMAELKTAEGLVQWKETVRDMMAKKKAADTRLRMDLTNRDPQECYSPVPYEKGYFFLRHIEQTIGRNKMDAFLSAYFKEFAFKSVDTDLFVRFLGEKLIGNDSSLEKALSISEWLDGEGLPMQLPLVESSAAIQIQKELEGWRNGKKASEIDHRNWGPTHQSVFIGSLPLDIPVERVRELESEFHFSQSGNVRAILVPWLRRIIRSRCTERYDLLEDVLTNWPTSAAFKRNLYSDLLATQQEKIAEKIFDGAKEGYHPVTRTSIGRVLGRTE